MSAGKGSRKGKNVSTKKYREGYEAIDWKKFRVRGLLNGGRKRHQGMCKTAP